MTLITMIKGLVGLTMIMLLCLATLWAQEPKAPLVVQKGMTVSIQYTIFDERNILIESNKGGHRATYVQGQGQLIPGVDRALEGMRVGEKKVLKLEPKDAYGEIDSKARYEVPKALIPAELQTPGAKILAHAGRQVVPGQIREIRENTVAVDVNHPLAGKAITVEFEVIDIIVPVQKPPLPMS